MIHVRVCTERSEIDGMVPECARLAEHAGCTLPFQYLHMPLLWWDHFSSADGADFHRKRGTNFLGSQSWLNWIALFLVIEDSHIIGAAPFVSYDVKTPGEQKHRRVFTFPGDFQLISYQDFLSAEERRRDVVLSIIDALIELADDEGDLIILPYVPDNSASVRVLQEGARELQKRGIHCTSALTGRRGGVRPYTAGPILSCLRKLGEACESSSVREEADALIEDLKSCSSMQLLFAQTRSRYEERIRKVIDLTDHDQNLSAAVGTLRMLLSDEPIIYPYIELPADREAYVRTLNKSTWKNFRNDKNKFMKNGGSFEKLSSSEIDGSDIDDYLRLHTMRWGGCLWE